MSEKTLERASHVLAIVACVFIILTSWRQAQVINDMRQSVARFKSVVAQIEERVADDNSGADRLTKKER